MQPHKLSLQQIKETDIIDYLKACGYSPQTVRGNDHWFLLPLHEERVPSFKVNRQLNCWYDHSLGRGGNLVDFLLLYLRCTVKELLQKMSDSLSFHQQQFLISPSLNNQNNNIGTETKIRAQNDFILPLAREDKRGIQIIEELPLNNSFLLNYVRVRNIPIELAQKQLKEVHYELNSKPYYALGFRNDSGGFELKNKYFKGSTSPKDVTTVLTNNHLGELRVFEGFFSFLSYLSIQEKNNLSLTNFLVLNSLSLFHRSLPKMEAYPTIHLYLDNDTAGNEVTARALEKSQKYKDKRGLYSGYKDINEWLVKQRIVQKQSRGLRL